MGSWSMTSPFLQFKSITWVCFRCFLQCKFRVRVPAHEPAPGAVPADPGLRQQGWFTVCTCKESAGRPAPKRAFQRTMNVVPSLRVFPWCFPTNFFILNTMHILFLSTLLLLMSPSCLGFGWQALPLTAGAASGWVL